MHWRRTVPLIAATMVIVLLAGCATGLYRSNQRAAWRTAAERQCVASGIVRPSAYVQRMPPIRGPGICGAEYPYRVSAALGGQVGFSQKAVLTCMMVPAIDTWVQKYLQPAARSLFGTELVQLQLYGSYYCRGRNGATSGALSEHGFANAVDVGGFVFADGRRIEVKQDWRGGSPDEQQFLRYAQRSACLIFRTVIGPDGDSAHQDHLHLDLARQDRAFRRHVCS